MIKAVLYSAHE